MKEGDTPGAMGLGLRVSAALTTTFTMLAFSSPLVSKGREEKEKQSGERRLMTARRISRRYEVGPVPLHRLRHVARRSSTRREYLGRAPRRHHLGHIAPALPAHSRLARSLSGTHKGKHSPDHGRPMSARPSPLYPVSLVLFAFHIPPSSLRLRRRHRRRRDRGRRMGRRVARTHNQSRHGTVLRLDQRGCVRGTRKCLGRGEGRVLGRVRDPRGHILPHAAAALGREAASGSRG